MPRSSYLEPLVKWSDQTDYISGQVKHKFNKRLNLNFNTSFQDQQNFKRNGTHSTYHKWRLEQTLDKIKPGTKKILTN
jgi:hypothetical protein